MTDWNIGHPVTQKDYLCTTTDGEVMQLYWNGSSWETHDGVPFNVIAYMSFPAPYQKPDKQRAIRYINDIIADLPRLRDSLDSPAAKDGYVRQVDKLAYFFRRDVGEYISLIKELEELQAKKNDI